MPGHLAIMEEVQRELDREVFSGIAGESLEAAKALANKLACVNAMPKTMVTAIEVIENARAMGRRIAAELDLHQAAMKAGGCR